MSPEYARVFLAEDNETMRGYARRNIEGASHVVAVEVSTLGEALAAIPGAKVLGVNVAVVDGNLSEDDVSGYDGNAIAAALRKEIPGIKIISFSGNEQPYGDIHVNKGKFDQVKSLGELITTL